MRLIGYVPTAPDARRFCDYLLARGMPAHAEQGSDGAWQIWIEHDDAQDAGRTELNRFQSEPADPRYDASDEAQRVRHEQATAAARRRKNFRDVRTTLFSAPVAASIPVSLALVVAAVAITLLTSFGQGGKVELYQALLFTTHPRHPLLDIVHGQAWRLWTPMFLHYDILHILFNSIWMLDLGRRVESVRGSLRYLALVLILALLSNGAEAAWEWTSARHVAEFGGLSGVVFGLFGYAWMCSRYRPYEQIRVADQETGLMIGWLLICSLGFVGPIANAAHWGGLLVGVGLGILPSVWKRAR